MSELTITTKQTGGISANTKSGLPNSCRFSRNLSIYDDDDSLTLNPATVKISGATVTGLIKGMIDTTPYEASRYACDDAGNIYKIDSNNTVTLDRTIAVGTPHGQGICAFVDGFYYSTATTIGRKYPLLNGSPSYNDNVFADGNTSDLDTGIFQTGSGQTYTPPVAISENAADTFSFTPTRDPLRTVEFFVTAKGTGDWTLTIHDVNNNVISTQTLTNGSITNGANNFWAFQSAPNAQVWWNIGQTYHFHMTSTVADGQVQTKTSANFSTVQISGFFGILVYDTDYHPMIQHTNGQTATLITGNGHYLAQFDGTTYNPNQITLEPGYKVRSFVRDNEFIVAMCWKGTNIDSFEDGKAFWWDGIQPYYNYAKPINGGSPNAAINYKSRVFSVLGSEGDMNLGTDPFVVLQHCPNIPLTNKIEVLPGAMTVWQRRVQFAYSNSDDSSIVEQGVYEWGNQSDKAITYTAVSTEVLNFGYTISTGTTKSTTLKIGLVQAFGKEMYIGWKDGSTYGLDRVARNNNPAATGSWESLIDDKTLVNNQFVPAPQKQKLAKKIIVTFSALPVGCTVTAKYKLERAGSWTSGTAAVAGSTQASIDIDKRYYEIEYGFDVTATVNYPTITGLTYVFDPLEKEVSFQ